jgi:hypothetical protein
MGDETISERTPQIKHRQEKQHIHALNEIHNTDRNVLMWTSHNRISYPCGGP